MPAFAHAKTDQRQRFRSYSEALTMQRTCVKIVVDPWTALAQSVHNSSRKKLLRGAKTHYLNTILSHSEALA